MVAGPFKPGERAAATGIYTATHDRHRLPHDVFAVEGDEFPECRKCGSQIRFSLLQAASHIDGDHDFSKAAPNSKSGKKQGTGDREQSGKR